MTCTENMQLIQYLLNQIDGEKQINLKFYYVKVIMVLIKHDDEICYIAMNQPYNYKKMCSAIFIYGNLEDIQYINIHKIDKWSNITRHIYDVKSDMILQMSTKLNDNGYMNVMLNNNDISSIFTEKIQYMVDNNYSVNTCDEFGHYPLYYLCLQNEISISITIIDIIAHNSDTHTLYTTISKLCSHRHANVIKAVSHIQNIWNNRIITSRKIRSALSFSKNMIDII